MLAVVIPVYNRADRLEKALKSLEQQTYRKFFTIVVDDCSTEDIKSICDKSLLNITYLRQEKNSGPSVARQKGLDLCIDNNIELIMFLDSDDLLMPHALQMLNYEINHTGKDLIASGIIWESEHEPNSTIYAPDNITWVGGKIYRVKSLVKYDINFNPNLRTNEDLEFNLKVRYSNMEKAYISDVLYLACNDKRSITRSNTIERDQCLGIDYIKAIYYTFKWCQQHNIELSHNIFNIFECYNYYEIWKEKVGLPPKEIDDMIIEMLTSTEFENKMKLVYYWNRIKTNSYYVENKKVYFFKETLYDWLKNHGYERS